MIAKILHVTDTHLGASGGADREVQGARAWRAFLDYVTVTQPDLVVVTGDIVVDDPDDVEDQAYAYEQLRQLPVPHRVVPGNHDVGDHAVREGLPLDWHGKVVTSQRVRAWRQRWGADHWLLESDNATFVGLNSQLIGSGLIEEQEQLEWLEREFAVNQRSTKPLLVFTHEALAGSLECHADSWMAAPTDGAARVRVILDRVGSYAVFSGHTHRFFDSTSGSVRQVTASSLSGPIPLRPDMVQAPGDRAAGWVEIGVAQRELSVTQRLLAEATLTVPTMVNESGKQGV